MSMLAGPLCVGRVGQTAPVQERSVRQQRKNTNPVIRGACNHVSLSVVIHRCRCCHSGKAGCQIIQNMSGQLRRPFAAISITLKDPLPAAASTGKPLSPTDTVASAVGALIQNPSREPMD